MTQSTIAFLLQTLNVAFKLLLIFTLLCFQQVSAANDSCPLNHICFALDQSGSISGDYGGIKAFTVGAARTLSNGTVRPFFSAVGFSDNSNYISAPTKDVTKFIAAIYKSSILGGSTNMGDGLSQCYTYVENKNGNRVIVLVTDGIDNGPNSAEDLVNSKKSSGVSLVTVGIGNRIDTKFLKRIATSPKFYIPVADPSVDISFILSSTICQVIPPQNSPSPKPSSSVNIAPKSPSPSPTFISISSSCAAAYTACDFKFSGYSSVPIFGIFGPPDIPFSTNIVSRVGPRIGIVNMNGIIPEFINPDGTIVPINMEGFPRLTPTHFKPFVINGSMFKSGIGHQTFDGNQLIVSRKRCIRVYFTSYQTLTSGPMPSVISNVMVSKSDNKCVVFKTA